jgi:serine/threonine protein kinase
MDKPHTDDVAVQRHIMGNPWGASVPHWSAEGYNDPPTDSLTLQNALLAWKRKFGDQQLKLGIKDSVPFEQGAILGSGGLGVVYETKIDGIAVAWKRTYMRRLKDEHLNEVKILGQMTEERHIHIVKLVGSYIHRQRNSTLELAILTWPVARCDLSVLLHEIDLINEWKFRDDPLDENDWSTSPTEEEKAAYDNLLKLEQLEQERFRIFTWHLREKVRDAALQRLTRSIGCIAKAVEYLHNRGIRHKDLKPSQILLSSNGLWLTDFGWSRDISHLTCSETSGGDRITVRYHAPERAHMGKCGRPEDVFALGCTFLEMAYRIYGKDSKDYLNPTGNPMWSFQANLGSKDVWLAPFQLDKMSSRSLLGGLVGRMLAYEAWLRPSISEVIEVLLTPTSQSDSSFFAGCCAPDPSMQSPGKENDNLRS